MLKKFKFLKIMFSIFGFILGVVVLTLFLCLIAYILKVCGVDNGFIDFMYKIMKFVGIMKT